MAAAICVLILGALLSWIAWRLLRGRERHVRLEHARLGVWFDDWTWMVAWDRADAERLLRDHYEGTDDTFNLLRQVPQNEEITLWIGDPDGPRVRRAAVVWADQCGRGVLGSTEV